MKIRIWIKVRLKELKITNMRIKIMRVVRVKMKMRVNGALRGRGDEDKSDNYESNSYWGED